MASTKKEGTALHKAEITNGGVALLKQVLPTMQWYKDKPMKVGLDGIALNESLSSIEKGPHADLTQEELAAKPVTEQQSIADEQEKWGNIPCTLEMTEGEREAGKACVKFFYKQGAFNLTKHVGILLRQFGLEDEA